MRAQTGRHVGGQKWGRVFALLPFILGLVTACGINHVPSPLMPPPGLGPLRVSPETLTFPATTVGKYSSKLPLMLSYDPPSLKPGFIIKRQPGRAFEVVEYCKEKPLPHCKVDVYFHPTTVGAADEDLTFQQPWADA